MAALSRRPALGESGSAAKRQRTEQMCEWGSASNATAKTSALQIAGGSASIPPCAYGDSRSCGSQPHPRRTCTEKESFTISRCQRRELVLWMLETVDHLGFCAETLHLAVNYFDRFVSQALLPGGHRFTALLGVTCLWTASKYEEVQSPTASEMVNIIADSYSVHQLLALEVSLLHGLHWELSHPTPLAFLHLYLQAMQVAPGALSCLADCLLELSLLDVGGSAVQQGSAALQPSRIAALALSTALTRAGQPERVSSVMQLAAWDNQHCIAHLAQALLQEFDHRQACLAQNQYCPIMARYANAQLRLDLAASALQPVARSTRSHAVSYPPSLGSNPSPQHHALLPEAAPQQKQQVVTSQQCMARGQEQCTRPEPSHLAVQPHLPAGPWSSCCPEPSSIPNSAREPAKTIRLQRWLSQAAEQQDQQHWQHQQDQQQECENDLDLPEPWLLSHCSTDSPLLPLELCAGASGDWEEVAAGALCQLQEPEPPSHPWAAGPTVTAPLPMPPMPTLLVPGVQLKPDVRAVGSVRTFNSCVQPQPGYGKPLEHADSGISDDALVYVCPLTGSLQSLPGLGPDSSMSLSSCAGPQAPATLATGVEGSHTCFMAGMEHFTLPVESCFRQPAACQPDVGWDAAEHLGKKLYIRTESKRNLVTGAAFPQPLPPIRALHSFSGAVHSTLAAATQLAAPLTTSQAWNIACGLRQQHPQWWQQQQQSSFWPDSTSLILPGHASLPNMSKLEAAAPQKAHPPRCLVTSNPLAAIL
ncbi:hypothetical protein QJQ45_008037 [Haematococcus lacustris]|nr:hypothetical protein QJQ45_008037 [Haematococcus lacustris]